MRWGKLMNYNIYVAAVDGGGLVCDQCGQFYTAELIDFEQVLKSVIIHKIEHDFDDAMKGSELSAEEDS